MTSINPTTVTLTETVSVTERLVTDDEKSNAQDYNKLVKEVIAFSRHQLRHGTMSTRLTLAKSVLPAASRLSAIDSKETISEHRAAMSTLVAKVLTLPAAQEELAKDAVELEAVSGRTLDQDDFNGD